MTLGSGTGAREKIQMKLRHVSIAAVVAAMSLSGGAAFAQAVGVDFGNVKSGVTQSGPETDKAAIDAPIVEPGYKVPRLADGKPDITGVWSNASNTALRRPGSSKNLVMTDDEAAKARANNPQNIRQQTDDHQKESDGLLTGKDLASGRGYNAFWIDPGNNYALVKGTWRTSWIVDPPSGQVPTKPGVAGGRGGYRQIGTGYDNPEERNLNERCVILGTSGPPIGNYLYNNTTQIVQSPGHVMIMSEMIHDARVIPLNAKHKPKELTPWMGDSIGWWDGDTLVVETINMQRGGGGVQLSPNGKITERFARYNDKQVFYEFEVNDPDTYTQVWKGQMSLNEVNGIYEYACHEGNYALHGILEAGRKNDREGKTNDSSKDGEE
jgi:hypothetical protein